MSAMTSTMLQPVIEAKLQPIEQRHSARYPVRLRTFYSGDLIDGNGTIVNLSSSGCSVKTASDVKDHSYVHLLLYLPEEASPLKIELAAVRWAKDRSFGLEFIRMSLAHQRRLREYLREIKVTPQAYCAA